MQLKINNVRISLRQEVSLEDALARKLDIWKTSIKTVQVIRKAIDARKKNEIFLNYHVIAEVDLKKDILKKVLTSNDVSEYIKKEAVPPEYGDSVLAARPVVLGAGPAGLLATLELARNGYKPILLERGKPVYDRLKDVETFWKKGVFNPESNVQFGAGGAGTFSDGKLTTRVNDPITNDILETFVKAGAPEEILAEHKPHVGTDKLRAMVTNILKDIEAHGGEVRYQSKVTDFILEGLQVKGVVINNDEKLMTDIVVVACGHSARDTYKVLHERNVGMEAKAFAIGLRVEHPQEVIDKAQYGEFAGHPKLGAADYALVYHNKDKSRTAYSFCMCPGGQVVASSSEEGGVVVNGMSMYHRDSGVANSALVVNVTPADFGDSPLAGIEFQRKYEKLAFEAGGSNYYAPAQNVKSFLDGEEPKLSEVDGDFEIPTYKPNVTLYDLSKVLPNYVVKTLRDGILSFDEKIKGFAGSQGILTGVETRTSAPLRIIRDRETFISVTHQGLYPCGEGAGYAGGIMSAALDGYHVARAIMKKYKPFN